MAAQPVEPLYLFPPKSEADPGFPVGGGTDPSWGHLYIILSKFQKTAWNRENFGPEGGTCRGVPLDPPLKMIHFILEGAASTPPGLVSPGKTWLRHWHFLYLVDLMKKFNSVRNSQA